MQQLSYRGIASNPVEISADFLGVCGLNFGHRHDSASRLHMLANQLGQALVIHGSTPRGIQTGQEREFGKYTFNVSMPCDAEILEIIPRYPQSKENPEEIVIYQDAKNGEIGVLHLNRYCSNHQYFGFRYVNGKDYNLLYPGSRVHEGAVFLESPSITPEGDYKYGIEMNVAYMTHPATSEDGVGICSDVLPRLGFRTYEERVVDYGAHQFLLNLYGDENNYKPFPEIGERVNDNGILCGLRSFEPSELCVVEQSRRDCMEIDYTFDRLTYAAGSGGIIRDIQVHHDITASNQADTNIDEQVQRYDGWKRNFSKKIVDFYHRLVKQRGDALQLAPELLNLIEDCLEVTNEGKGPRIQKVYRQVPLDTYRIKFIIEYDILPSVGNKITDCHGKIPVVIIVF